MARHDPLLSEVIDAERKATVAGSQKVGGKKKERSHQEESEFMSAKMSHKTLALAREQQAEVDADGARSKPTWSSKGAGGAGGRAAADSDSDADFSDDDDEMGAGGGGGGGGGGLVRMAGDVVEAEDMQLEEADEAALAAFMGGAEGDDGDGGGGSSAVFGMGGSLNLADLIMEKIREKEERDANGGAAPDDGSEAYGAGMNPKVVAVYTSIGKLLKLYRAGKLPKAFKIIPALTNWEEVVWLTAPHEWSAQAMYGATRIFASNMNPRMSQRFFNVFLLETVRDDIRNNASLNYHYYRALKKTLYRPAAFYKGIMLPLCESGSCTLREAAIIGSVIAKVSIPIMHSAAALLRLAQMRYTGPISILIRVLLDKKYSLPYSVIDGVVAHFLRMTRESRALSVLWHQSLLVFVQRYKQDIKREQKEQFKELFKKHQHRSITPEVRRELFSSRARGEKAPQTTTSMLD